MRKYNKFSRCRCRPTYSKLSQDESFPVVTVLRFRPIVRIFMLSVIVKLFEAIVRTCEIKVYDETHKFVMLTISRPNS